jgi:hypothetical protein
MLETEDRINDEESPEQKQLCENEEPHAQFGADIVPVFVVMCSALRH